MISHIFTIIVYSHSFQTAAMFLGELLCLIPHNIQLLYYKIKGKKTAEESSEDSLIEKKPKPFTNPLIFWIPACCDLGGSTLLSKFHSAVDHDKF